MDGNAGFAQIIVADGEHAHHREDPAHHRKLGFRANTDGAMALLRDAVERAGRREAGTQRRVLSERSGIDLGHQ